MKLILLIVAFALGFVGCTPTTDDNGKESKRGYQVMTVNGCQYVIYIAPHSYGGATMVHAGNCNNPIHSNQEIK